MKVIVVEDQTLFREFLVNLLENTLNHEVAGTAEDGPEALRLIRKTKPDLVMLDILIPKLSGIHVAMTLKKELPRLRIIALSNEMDARTIQQVSQLRLTGFINKNEADVDVLTKAIELAEKRLVYISESIRERLREMRLDPMAFQKILTPREQEVLTLIGSGMDDDAIAEGLGLTPLSAHSHRQNLLRKLDLHSTPELMRFALEQGFWKPEFPRMDLEGNRYHAPG